MEMLATGSGWSMPVVAREGGSHTDSVAGSLAG
jgi:hypothetical protein